MLYRVTVTGADDRTSIDQLLEINRRFPFVEWGILASPRKTGQPRYPTSAFIGQLLGAGPLHLSLHLCGGYVMAARRGDYDAMAEASAIWPVARRVQLNLGWRFWALADNTERDAVQRIAWAPSTGGRQVILQAPRDVSLFVDGGRGFGGGLTALYDRSGGRGRSPGQWLAVCAEHCGFAGGLGPDNIERELPRIREAAGSRKFWIDAESGVRTDDRFDLQKVEALLDACAPHVT